MIAFFEWLKQGLNIVYFVGIVSFLGWIIEDIIKAARRNG